MAQKKRSTTSKAKVVANSTKSNRSWLQSRWTTILIVVVVAVMGVITLVLTRAMTAEGPILGIASKCLDNAGARVADSNKIQLYRCNGTVAQKWSIPGDGTLRVQGYCLDVRAASKAQETPVQLYHCNGTVAQKWTINKDGSIVNPNSGLCLDDKYANTADGTQIWMWKCNGTAAQKWTTPKTTETPPNPQVPPKPTPTPPAPTPTPPNPQNPPTTSDGPRGKGLYVSPSYANAGRPAALSSQPIAEWYGDWTPTPGPLVKGVVDGAEKQGKLAQLVAYNIVNRDCNGASKGGANDANAYKTWIRSLASGIGKREAIVVLEPDVLGQFYCLNLAQQNERMSLIADAVDVLTSQTKAYVYIDVAHSAWGGVSIDDWAYRLQKSNVAKARGFSTNVSNFQTTANEVAFGDKISAKIGGKPFVFDTSRNGKGPKANEWCNPDGRGLGKKPTTSTGVKNVDAYLWIKRAGESDGLKSICGHGLDGAPSAGQWFEPYAQMLIKNAQY